MSRGLRVRPAASFLQHCQSPMSPASASSSRWAAGTYAPRPQTVLALAWLVPPSQGRGRGCPRPRRGRRSRVWGRAGGRAAPRGRAEGAASRLRAGHRARSHGQPREQTPRLMRSSPRPSPAGPRCMRRGRRPGAPLRPEPATRRRVNAVTPEWRAPEPALDSLGVHTRAGLARGSCGRLARRCPGRAGSAR